jgi:hypothetical protein
MMRKFLPLVLFAFSTPVLAETYPASRDTARSLETAIRRGCSVSASLFSLSVQNLAVRYSVSPSLPREQAVCIYNAISNSGLKLERPVPFLR